MPAECCTGSVGGRGFYFLSCPVQWGPACGSECSQSHRLLLSLAAMSVASRPASGQRTPCKKRTCPGHALSLLRARREAGPQNPVGE
jgi:hypothetical protein